MRYVKGSTTVEMAYVMPLIFLVFLIIVRTTFYYHDKSILDGMAYEAVTTAVQTARNPKAKEADVETFCRERIRWKLIYFSMPEVSVNVTDDEAETTIFRDQREDVYPGNKTGKNPASGEKDPFEEKSGNQ